MIGIYMITNQVNNKVYIGQSQNIELRWKAHRNRPFNPNSNDYEKPLYRAIRKYDLDNFTFQILEECEIKDLDNREMYWIAYYNSTDAEKGYNLTKGGETGVPKKLSEEERDRIIEYLQSSDKTQEEIAEEFNISQRLVSGINLGEYWIREDIVYPIRKRQENCCLICGKKIFSTSKYCIVCSGITHRKVERPEREKLKNLIRTMPFTQIGKNYDVSDNAIRKWCQSEGLPSKSSVIKKYSDEEWLLI